MEGTERIVLSKGSVLLIDPQTYTRKATPLTGNDSVAVETKTFDAKIVGREGTFKLSLITSYLPVTSDKDDLSEQTDGGAYYIRQFEYRFMPELKGCTVFPAKLGRGGRYLFTPVPVGYKLRWTDDCLQQLYRKRVEIVIDGDDDITPVIGEAFERIVQCFDQFS